MRDQILNLIDANFYLYLFSPLFPGKRDHTCSETVLNPLNCRIRQSGKQQFPVINDLQISPASPPPPPRCYLKRDHKTLPLCGPEKKKPCHKVPEKYFIKSHYHYFNHVLDLPFFPSLRSLSFCSGRRILDTDTASCRIAPPGDYYCHIILLSFHLKSFWKGRSSSSYFWRAFAGYCFTQKKNNVRQRKNLKQERKEVLFSFSVCFNSPLIDDVKCVKKTFLIQENQLTKQSKMR